MTNSEHAQDEAIRTRVIEEHARDPHPHLDREAMRAHLLIHEMVEKQLAERDPPEVASTLHRLLAGGLDRHEAVHAIGAAVAGEAFRMLKERRALDREAYVQALGSLTAESWRQSMGRND